MLMILIPVTILIGFIVTFSLMSGKQQPLDLLGNIKSFMNNYLLIGVLILIVIVFFGLLLFLREKFLGSS